MRQGIYRRAHEYVFDAPRTSLILLEVGCIDIRDTLLILVMCISSRGTLVMYISSRDISCTLCIDISKLSHLGHMVYRRVSNLFDYSLHVLVPCGRHLDISMLSIHNCIAFYYLFIHTHSYHIMRFSCVFVLRDVFM